MGKHTLHVMRGLRVKTNGNNYDMLSCFNFYIFLKTKIEIGTQILKVPKMNSFEHKAIGKSKCQTRSKHS
jgi:hypothetical protein